MAQAIENSGSLPAEIAGKLGALRRKLNIWLLLNGLARLLIAAVLLLALDFVIDRFFEMDHAQRLILLIAIGLALLVVLFWGLVRPFLSTTRDDALVLEVEDRNRELNETLISAVQFSREETVAKQGVSRAMVDETIRQGTERASAIDFGGILHQGKLWMNIALLCVSFIAIAFAGFQILQPDSDLAIWFNRNILMGDREYPKDTYLFFPDIDGNEITIARGESFQLLVAVDEETSVKKDVNILLDYVDAGETSTQTMRPFTRRIGIPERSVADAGDATVATPDPQKNKYVFERVFQNVSSEFRFRARGGDAITRWVQVKLVEPPAVTDLKIVVTHPEYAFTELINLEGSGPHLILKGSGISLTANANKPLSRAVLQGPGGNELPLQSDEPGSLKLAASISASDLVAGKYRFLLTDQLGLSTSRPPTFDIRIRADRPPIVRARLQGVSGLVVSRAIVPIGATIRDDFAVTAAKIVYNWKADSGNSVAQTGELQLQSPAEEDFGKPDLTIDADLEEMDLEPLKIPAGAGLRFLIRATDNDTISGPNDGDSTEFLLRIVTEDELRTDMLRRETEQRQEFERMLGEQRDLLTESESMAADTAEGAKDVERFYSDQRKNLISFKRRQKLLITNLSNVANRFQEFLIEALNNRLEDSRGSVRRRLSAGIIEPMRSLSQNDVEEAVVQLELARRHVNDAENWQSTIDNTVAVQTEIVRQMEEILLQMAKQESFQEAVNLLRSIEKAEGELMSRVRKEKAARLDSIFKGLDDESEDKTDGDEKENSDPTEKAADQEAAKQEE